MNKSYKVLFNTIRGVSAVVSEITSSKQSRKKATVAVAVAVVMGMMAGQAIAEVAYYGQHSAPSTNVWVTSAGSTSNFTKTWDGQLAESINFLYGGYSDEAGAVSSNSVTVSGGTITSGIYGGWANLC